MCVCARLCVSEIVWGVRVRVYMFCLVAACVRVSCFLFFMYTGAGACVSGAGCVSRPVVLPYFFRRAPLPRAAGPPGAHSSHSPAHSRPHTRTCADVCMRMWGVGLLASGVARALPPTHFSFHRENYIIKQRGAPSAGLPPSLPTLQNLAVGRGKRTWQGLLFGGDATYGLYCSTRRLSIYTALYHQPYHRRIGSVGSPSSNRIKAPPNPPFPRC